MTPLYIVIGIVVIALIALTIVYFIQQKKKKKALAAESGEAAGPGDDEISQLIHEAENKLAAAKLEQGARIGTLPVFLLVGDAGCAKTSVMLHSGLDPELLAGQVYQQGNVTSTRTANFWYSRRAIFVEAAGRLLADAPKWKKLVQKLQPRSSVVGKGEQAPRAAIVCFDCESFTKPGALELAANAARGFRARLGEISQALGINLPVYALFTKMDRLPFFTEYVRNFSNDEASQVLGVTLPMLGARPEGVYAEQEAARLSYSFESIFRALAEARIEFLPRENDTTKLPGEYEFPREFRKTRQTIVQFLIDLCRPSQLTTGPFLRGFYFTGVRPVVINETAPVQAAAPQQGGYGAPAGATGIFRVGASQPAAQAAQPVVIGTRKVPQWMFLGQLFTGVLLADHGAMGASGASTKTSGSRRLLFAIAAALCLLFAIFFTVSFFNNHGLETQVGDAAKGIASGEAVGADLASVDSLRKLDTLRQSVQTLATYHREGAPLMYRWGLFIGDDLYPVARRVYFARFKQLLFAQTQTNTLGFLGSLPATAGPDYNTTYDALKSYLITTSNHDKSTKLFLAPTLMKWWQNGRSADPDRQQLAQKQFEFYSDELKEENPYSSENDAASIEKARRYLAQFAGADRVYAFMLSEAAKGNPPINFNRQYPGSVQVVVEAHEVPGAFGKSGWAFMKDAIGHADRYFNGERWVLGDYASANIDRVKLEQDLKSRYYADFLKEWRTYMKSATVVRYAGLKDASAKLTTLSGNQSPLLELFALASTNTAVDEPSMADVFQPVQAVVPPGSTDRFIAPPNKDYMTALINLQTAIDSVANLPGPPSDAAAAPALTAAQQATTATRQMAQVFRIDKDGHVEAVSQNLLEEPIIYVTGMLRALGPAELNAKGKDLCGQLRPLTAKYPFSPNSKTEATLQDINTIFKPKEGAIWAFYDANLQKVLQRQGSQFVPASGTGMTINPAFLAMMNRAGAFTEAAYANGATDPHIAYNVKPDMGNDEDSIKMTIDGQTVEFTAANQAPKQFVWPGAAKGVQTAVKFKGTTPYAYPTYDGLWAIFQFVQDADKHAGSLVEMVLKAGKQGKTVNLESTGQPVTLRFEISANPPVFDKNYFAGMGCVADVAR
jgi:type VI secretion system protein ImpL